MKRALVLTFITLLLANHVPAQLYRYLDIRDGLSSRRVLSIEKDKKGYIWLLTHEGVDKYNGKEYVHYPLTDGEKKFQQFPNLNKLGQDSQGGIWVLGKNGYFFRYNPAQDKYDVKLNFLEKTQSKKRLPLTMTYLDSEDNLWMATKTKQYIYRIQTEEFIELESPIQEEITFMTQTKENTFFLGTNHNVYQATLQGKQLSVKTDPLLENFHIIHHLYFHEPTEQLIIGTLMDGFYLYSPKKQTLEALGNMTDVNINKVAPVPDSKTEVLLATDGSGIFRLNLANKSLEPYLSVNHHYSNKMNGDIIKDIYIDDEKRIWMAVFPVGVTVFSDKYPEYEWLKHSPDNPNSLINNQVTYLLQDSDGDIWAATGNGVCCYNIRTQKWTSILSSYQQDKHEQNHVFISLCESTPGTILVGGYMAGMYRINKKDMKPQYFSPQGEGYTQIRPDKYIRSIYRDEEGNVWAGGYYNFKRIDPHTGEMNHYTTEYPITFITSKNKDELWLGTINGLYKFNKKQKKIQQANLNSDIGTINTIYQDGDQTTYIGTNGNGLWVYNNQTEDLKNFHTANSALICNNIYCILPGSNPNELIISTENELVCYDIDERLFLNWTQEQGLLSAKFNTAAGIHTRGGVFAFGSGEGMIIIKDSINLPRLFQSKMVFTGFNIYYQKILPGDENSPLKQSIDETQEIVLSHDQNIFSLNVSSINYDCPSRILYSWQLEGFYDVWTTPSDAPLIRYTNINPGTYTLKVRSILLDDGHTLEERALKIIIKPPFSQTIWAWMIYISIVILIIFAVIRYLWLKKDSDISKEKIQFFINTAHDIRTPLTLIKAPLSEINKNETLSEQGKANLDMAIHSTDKLSELATKLIDFQKEELYTSDVNVTRSEINDYLSNFLQQFEMYAKRKNIQFEFVGTEQPLHAWIDQNKIDSIVHNLVSNALKYTPEGGKVQVLLKNTDTHWLLWITDTGIGISSKDQKKMFKHLFRGDNAVNLQITGSGIGMLQTYKLVVRHQGKITVNSKENEGTTFQLSFPINHSRFKHHEEIHEKDGWKIPMQEEEREIPQGAEQEPLPVTDSANKTIMLVEDNIDLRRFLRQCLSKTYQIMEANNGQEALNQIAKRQPDLVLSDVMMPIMRGDDMCRILKENVETCHIPIILLTALNDRLSIIHGLEIKADNYIVKPFDIDILKANIDSILANKEFIKQRFAQLNYQTDDLPPEIQEIPGLDLDQEFLTKTTALVKQNLGKDFNVDDLCMEMGMSRSSFYNKIKALTNCSPSEFVRQIRMKEATILLKSQRYTIAEVSDLLGYGDPKYFTDIFKKHYGMTPSAYMKQEKK